MIYWVNSFHNPLCLLASSSTDFKDGIIFCEIVSILKGVPSFSGVNQTSPPNAETSISNISLALSELQSCSFLSLPKKIAEMNPEEIYNSEEAMYDFLNFLKSTFEGNKTKSESTPLKSEIYIQDTQLEANSSNNNNIKTSEDTAKFPMAELKAIRSKKQKEAKVDSNLKKSASKKKPPRMPSVIQSEPKQKKQSIHAETIPSSTRSANKKGISIANTEKQIENCLNRGIMQEGPRENKIQSYSFPISTGPSYFGLMESLDEEPIELKQETRARQFSGLQSAGQASQKATPRVTSSRSSIYQPKTEYHSRPSSRDRTTQDMPLQIGEDRSPIKQSPLGKNSQTITPYRENKQTHSYIQVEKVDIKIKHKLLEWLEEIHLIKQNAATIADFPGYCRNGVLLADLIMRLEGVNITLLKKLEEMHTKRS